MEKLAQICRCTRQGLKLWPCLKVTIVLRSVDFEEWILVFFFVES